MKLEKISFEAATKILRQRILELESVKSNTALPSTLKRTRSFEDIRIGDALSQKKLKIRGDFETGDEAIESLDADDSQMFDDDIENEEVFEAEEADAAASESLIETVDETFTQNDTQFQDVEQLEENAEDTYAEQEDAVM